MHNILRKYLVAVLVICLLAGCGNYVPDIVGEVVTEVENLLPESEAENFVKTEQEVSLDIPEENQKEELRSISEGNYAYECLDEEEKTVYDQMLTAILGFEEKVELPTTDTGVMRKAYLALNSDYGGLFWIDGYVFTQYTKGNEPVGLEFSPNYSMSREEQKEIQSQIDEVAEQWLSGISITDSDYEKVKYVFETLIQNVDYVEEAEDSQNIKSVFINKKTVCQGYACATQYLLKYLGIPSMVVSGRANGQSHAWNIVYLDGSYYHLDTTWGNSSYLDLDDQESKYVNYNYLCMTSREMLLTHSPSNELALPECTAIENNYYVREGRYFESWEPELMGEILKNAWETGEESVALKFSGFELYERAKDHFIIQQGIVEYCRGLESVYYLEDKELYVLTINFN